MKNTTKQMMIADALIACGLGALFAAIFSALEFFVTSRFAGELASAQLNSNAPTPWLIAWPDLWNMLKALGFVGPIAVLSLKYRNRTN